MLIYWVNLLILISTGCLSIMNQIYCMEYIINQKCYNHLIYTCFLSSILLFYIISFVYVFVMILTFSASTNEELNELDYCEYELSLASKSINNYGYWSVMFILPYYFFLMLTKLIGFYHLKAILQAKNKLYFPIIKSQTLFISYMIQFIFLTIPQFFLQILNNLLLVEDVNNKYAQGVINKNSIIAILLICSQGFIFLLATCKKFNDWNDAFTIQISKSFIEKSNYALEVEKLDT